MPSAAALANDGDDLIGGDLALERAAERHGHRQRDRRAAVDLAPGDYDRQRRDLFRDRGALVAHAEAVGGADYHIGLVAAAGDGALPAARVQDQADTRCAPLAGQCGHDLLGAGHLRHAARIDEGHRFDAANPTSLQAANEFHLHRRVENCFFVLQAVSRPHLDNLDLGSQRTLSCAVGSCPTGAPGTGR